MIEIEILKDAVETGKKIAELYEKSGRGHSQKNAINTLIACAAELKELREWIERIEGSGILPSDKEVEIIIWEELENVLPVVDVNSSRGARLEGTIVATAQAIRQETLFQLTKGLENIEEIIWDLHLCSAEEGKQIAQNIIKSLEGEEK